MTLSMTMFDKEKLRILRENKGLNIAEAAREIGAARQNWNAWEKGDAKPNSDSIGKIADLFGVSVSSLYTRYTMTEVK